MPRKAFVADLLNAVVGNLSIPGIAGVQQGGDDGEFTFECVADGETFTISALIPDVSEYPSSHACMIFAPDDAPASMASTLSDISDSATGKTIIQLLELVSRKLETIDKDGDTQMLDSQEFDDDDFEDDDDEVDEYFPDDDMVPKPVISTRDGASSIEGYTKPTSAFRSQIRSDLLTAKAHGFKVGHLGGLMDGLGCYISLSCRISKLGISEEAMQAWQVEPSEYLVVIFHYPNGYKNMSSMKAYDAPSARRNFGVRVGISSTYKPTMREAVRAFTILHKEEEKRREESQTESQSQGTAPKGFRNSFISRPLNELLEERFPTLLHYRYNGMPWNGAELFYNEHYGANRAHSDLGYDERYMAPENVHTAYPPLVTADHIQESVEVEHSLPLVGMQFVLRHFVRCTEFCLVCFSRLADELQAIKPYVCDKPLCLYQYMSLGFGPSIEHEILSQPKVVDLLISFCYTSARLGSLKDFPAGLSLMVPPNCAYNKDYTNNQQNGYSAWNQTPQQVDPKDAVVVKATPMRFNHVTREIIFDNKAEKCPLRTGDWIIIRTDENKERGLHCRVTDTMFYPTVKVSEPVEPAVAADQQYNSSNQYGNTYRPPPVPTTKQAPKPQTALPMPKSEFRSANFYIYDQNFDELHEFHKREAIFALLDILPSVADMKQYLARKAQSPLSSWVDRIPPAALGLLRWIIASNRACIMQVGEDEDDSRGMKGVDREYGMSGWSQFRFAMGAPDKERKFLQAVRETTNRLKLKYSTLFAWHGSPIVNWHSIIRQGLHFDFTAHGRAFGNGVYHSLDCNTSIGYSGHGTVGSFWPMSELKISQALALNEIVNAPKEFVSSSPHLVVSQLDWIQTRYLFVKTQSDNVYTSNTKEARPPEHIEQDPNMSPVGANREKIMVPINAVSVSRRPRSHSGRNSMNKRRKTASGSALDPINLDVDDDDGASVATLEEDLVIFRDEDIHVPQPDNDPLPTPNSIKGKGKASTFLSKLVGSKSSNSKPLTDFVPGTLDFSTLPMLQQPEWATPSATKRLMKDFQDLLKVQAKEPPHELGWYIDPERVDNMYQWIVELHSFDPTLPLAKDMKAQGHKSIVLELRFGNSYPMSPPFVRVIRPRFLGFQQGGGGHVTAGGAMCMQLLTNDGWSAASSIESILLQVRMAMSSLDPKPARLEGGSRSDYGVGEAIEAYIRACQVHGWRVPEGFRELALGGVANASLY